MTIALLTDFGTRDTYVGVMKGVIATIAPGTTVVDLTHEVEPQNVRQAAFHLLTSYRYFPAGIVFCVVVDPEVGTKRHPLAARSKDHVFVCPDNGLLTPFITKGLIEEVVVLDNPSYHLPQPSQTFHGRDIFAPAAAHLSLVRELVMVGSPTQTSELNQLEWPMPKPTRGGWEGEVSYIDHFGNLITNLESQLLGSTEGWVVQVGNVDLPVDLTFADVDPSQLVSYVGSSGLLEVAVRNSNAHLKLGIGVGEKVRVVRPS